jgi:hypothetical protein
MKYRKELCEILYQVQLKGIVRSAYLAMLCTLLKGNHYLVRFENGEEKELPSAVLKVESIVAAPPPLMHYFLFLVMCKRRECYQMM